MKVYAIIEMDVPNLQDMAGEDHSERLVEAELRCTRDYIRRQVMSGCYDVIQVKAGNDVPEMAT